MPEEQEKSGGLRFRLPKLFAETEEEATAEPSGAPAPARPSAPPAPRRVQAAAPPAGGDGGIEEVKQGLEEIYAVLTRMNERESNQEKVFNALYEEMNGYKNDFLYEHMKPVIRPLLFLYDSLDQFEQELTGQIKPATEERRRGLSPTLVRQNIQYFRDQLVEALQICEVTMMETPAGMVDLKLHKVVKVVPVTADQDRMVQQVVRQGWYQNNQLLRPAEVVIGKAE